MTIRHSSQSRTIVFPPGARRHSPARAGAHFLHRLADALAGLLGRSAAATATLEFLDRETGEYRIVIQGRVGTRAPAGSTLQRDRADDERPCG